MDTAAVVSVLGNDGDPERDPLSVGAVTQGADGTVVINGDNAVTYTPNTSQTGAGSFSNTISDGGTDTATVTVNAVNPAPTAGADSATTVKDTAVITGAIIMITLAVLMLCLGASKYPGNEGSETV